MRIQGFGYILKNSSLTLKKGIMTTKVAISDEIHHECANAIMYLHSINAAHCHNVSILHDVVVNVGTVGSWQFENS